MRRGTTPKKIALISGQVRPGCLKGEVAMRCIKRLLVLAACLLFVAGSAGCSSSPSSAPQRTAPPAPASSSTSPAPQASQEKLAGEGAAASGKGSDSPQAVFETATSAQKKEDFKTYTACLSPEAQKQQAADLAFGALSQQQAAHGPMGEKYREQFKLILAVLDKHGLTYDVTKKFKTDLTDPKAIQQTRRELEGLIKDPGAFAADMMEAYAKTQSLHQGKLPQIEYKLTDVKVQGDKATGVAVMTMEGKEQKQPVGFVKVGGSWKIAPEPEALGPPGGR
jgi:hypothetical protein